MARTRRGTILSAVILLLAAGLVYAQTGSATRTYQVVINVDVSGAAISVDSIAIKGNTVNLTGGIHRISVKAEGYEDYTENASITSDRTITIKMRPRIYQITIKTNVSTATVLIDGARITGSVVSVSHGFHTLKVTAPGYSDYDTTINVTGPTTVTVQLEQQGIRLAVNSNVAGAAVSVNGVTKGTTPYAEVLAPGTYTVKVSARGYLDYVTSVSLSKPTTLTAELRPAGYQLSVNSNVPGAVVSINNVVKGAAPYAEVLPAGTYTVKVTARGYADYVSTVSLTQATSITAELRPTGYQLSVNSNVPGAVVSINNVVKGSAPYSEVLSPGTYTVKVTARGYFDYVTSVSLTQAMSLTAELRPSGYQLSVNSNVQGALVSINNAVKGITPYSEVLSPGSYTVKVTATGYTDYVTSVSLTQSMILNAELRPSGYQLSVSSNVQGAVVSINNVVKGLAPYSEVLPPGTYVVKVTATGFTDYLTSVVLDRPVAINAQLSTGMTTFSLSLPAAFLDPDAKDVPGQIRIYVDGRHFNPKKELSNIPIAPGRHSVRVTSGVFSIEIGEMDFQPGVNYVFELSMDLKIKTSR